MLKSTSCCNGICTATSHVLSIDVLGSSITTQISTLWQLNKAMELHAEQEILHLWLNGWFLQFLANPLLSSVNNT